MPTPPGTYDLVRKTATDDRRIVQGADNFWALSFDSGFGSDWAGFAARAQLRRAHSDYDSTVDASITATIIDPGPAQRIISFWVPNATTATLTTDDGRWSCEIFNGALVYRVVDGVWVLNREVVA